MSINYIKNVKLNYKYYKGNDFYSDGYLLEEEILEIVKNNNSYEEILKKTDKWPILYHLSEVRENLLEWIPFEKNSNVLEIGAGCGALTGVLAKKCKSVKCIELSEKRSIINAYKNSEYDNIEIFIGNFEDIYLDEKFDYITLIGVLEYSGLYIQGSRPYENLIKKVKKLLNKNGSIIIGIENKFGLKYWAGCKEDHTSIYFDGLEDYKNNDVRTFTKKELEDIFISTGMSNFKFFYPYPDYKLPTHIYSDDYLPKVDDLNNNFRNFDNDRLILFDEKKVFNNIIKNNMFDIFSNSFLCILKNNNNHNEYENYLFSKYSNERNDEFKIRTSIIKTNSFSNQYIVTKNSLKISGQAHLNNILSIYNRSFQNIKTAIEPKKILDNSIRYDFIEGKTLDIYLNECYKKNGLNAFLFEIKKFRDFLFSFSKDKNFAENLEFRKIFGTQIVNKNLISISSDYMDCIPSNIIFKDNLYYIIDQEWGFKFDVPFNYIIFRIIYTLNLENVSINIILNLLEIYDDEIKIYDFMEKNFQNYVNGKVHSLFKSFGNLDMKNININEILYNSIEKNYIQIFRDYGRGYSEENSYKLKFEKGINFINLKYEDNLKNIRIDPSINPCIVIIECISPQIIFESIFSNGTSVDEKTIFFSMKDPQINFNIENYKFEDLKICLRIFEVDDFAAEIIHDLICELKKRLLNQKNMFDNLNETLDVSKKKYENFIKTIKKEYENSIEITKSDYEKNIYNLKKEIQEIYSSRGWKILSFIKKIFGK